MKNNLLTLLLFFIVVQTHGQGLDSLTISELKLNFAVPDLPAFKSLSNEPSDLLRPSTPKALSAVFSPFYDHQKIIIPKAFAMEISPALLINANKGPAQLKTYADNAWINSFRVSLGAATDTSFLGTGQNMALGLRITPIDKSDPLADKTFIDSLSVHLGLFRKSEAVYKRQFAESIIDSVKHWAGQNQKPSVLDSIIDWDFFLDRKISKGTGADTIWKTNYANYKAINYKDSYNDFDVWLVQEKENRKKYLWNATKLDIAAAVLSTSSDSLVKNVAFNKAELWLTYAHRAGKSSQYLIGLTGSVFKNFGDTIESKKNKTYWNISVPLRYLVGTNRIKGFAELQYRYDNQSKISNTFFALGAELNLIDGLWVNLYGGLKNNSPGGKTAFTTNFDFKLTLPEKFKLF